MGWIEPNTPGWIVQPVSESDWRDIARDYDSALPDPFEQVLAVVRANGCQTVVVENRYVDRDFRADHQMFWSTKFDPPSPFARRLHFFRARLNEDDLVDLPEDPGYLGYTVLRPLVYGRVGRTVLAPPPHLANAALALIDDEVSLWGNRLTVSGVPFSQQDTQFLTCAHVTAWICHYIAWRHGLSGRRTTAEIVAASPPTMSERRVVPSPGMTLKQLQAVFAQLGQPALFYGLSQLPDVTGVETPGPPTAETSARPARGFWDTRIFSVICRYLNSGFPVLVAGGEHALALVGWFREGRMIRFVSCDDQTGPYSIIDLPFTHSKAPWHSIMVPLPPRVLVSGEAAENRAHLGLLSFAAGEAAPPEWARLGERLRRREISLRTVLKSVRDYKEQLAQQGRARESVRVLRFAHLSHFVWVVEAQDRERRRRGEPSVVAELVFDATSNDRDPVHSAVTLPGLSFVFAPHSREKVAAPNRTDFWTSLLSLPRRRPTLPTPIVEAATEVA